MINFLEVYEEQSMAAVSCRSTSENLPRFEYVSYCKHIILISVNSIWYACMMVVTSSTWLPYRLSYDFS